MSFRLIDATIQSLLPQLLESLAWVWGRLVESLNCQKNFRALVILQRRLTVFLLLINKANSP